MYKPCAVDLTFLIELAFCLCDFLAACVPKGNNLLGIEVNKVLNN
jgi:hypothetical protein